MLSLGPRAPGSGPHRPRKGGSKRGPRAEADRPQPVRGARPSDPKRTWPYGRSGFWLSGRRGSAGHPPQRPPCWPLALLEKGAHPSGSSFPQPTRSLAIHCLQVFSVPHCLGEEGASCGPWSPTGLRGTRERKEGAFPARLTAPPGGGFARVRPEKGGGQRESPSPHTLLIQRGPPERGGRFRTEVAGSRGISMKPPPQEQSSTE